LHVPGLVPGSFRALPNAIFDARYFRVDATCSHEEAIFDSKNIVWHERRAHPVGAVMTKSLLGHHVQDKNRYVCTAGRTFLHRLVPGRQVAALSDRQIALTTVGLDEQICPCLCPEHRVMRNLAGRRDNLDSKIFWSQDGKKSKYGFHFPLILESSLLCW
jgi:hypothetical protein